MRKHWKSLLKLTITLILMVFLLRLVGWQETLAELRMADPRFLTGALLLFLLTMLVRAWRWQAFLDGQGISVSVVRLTYLYFVGSFFNMVLPSGMGGDVIKFYELARHHDGQITHFRSRIASSLLADRISGLVVLFLMGSAVVPWARGLDVGNALVLLLFLTLGSLVGLSLLLKAEWRRWMEAHLPGMRMLVERRALRGLYSSLDGYHRAIVLRALFFSFLFNVLIVATNLLIGWAYDVDISIVYYLIFVPLISFTLALPFSINGLGVREGAYVALFAQAGVVPSIALAMSLTFYAITLITGLIGGLLYLVEALLALRRGKVSPNVGE